jgi:hypothetical protein
MAGAARHALPRVYVAAHVASRSQDREAYTGRRTEEGCSSGRRYSPLGTHDKASFKSSFQALRASIVEAAKQTK